MEAERSVKILSVVRELVRKMFASKTIKEIYSADIAVSDLMMRRISDWVELWI